MSDGLFGLLIAIAVLQGLYFSWLSWSIMRLRKGVHSLRNAMQVVMIHDPDLKKLMEEEDARHASDVDDSQ